MKNKTIKEKLKNIRVGIRLKTKTPKIIDSEKTYNRKKAKNLEKKIKGF